MSNHDDAALRDVLSAAEAVLAARENQMLTSEEWDALEHAVAAATQPPPSTPRDETFTVTENILVRAVTPARGTPYQHTCDKDVFESVAHAIDELNGASLTYEEIRSGSTRRSRRSRSPSRSFASAAASFPPNGDAASRRRAMCTSTR